MITDVYQITTVYALAGALCHHPLRHRVVVQRAGQDRFQRPLSVFRNVLRGSPEDTQPFVLLTDWESAGSNSMTVERLLHTLLGFCKRGDGEAPLIVQRSGQKRTQVITGTGTSIAADLRDPKGEVTIITAWKEDD